MEQAGFRRNYSTIDHLLTVKVLIRKANEYHLPLYVALVDYEKAFDSIKTWATREALRNNRVDCRYMDLITFMKRHKLHFNYNNKQPIKIYRGVREDDALSPKLFIIHLKAKFKKLEWETKDINISGSYLSHLKYADDIILFSQRSTELQEMHVASKGLNYR